MPCTAVSSLASCTRSFAHLNVWNTCIPLFEIPKPFKSFFGKILAEYFNTEPATKNTLQSSHIWFLLRPVEPWHSDARTICWLSLFLASWKRGFLCSELICSILRGKVPYATLWKMQTVLHLCPKFVPMFFSTERLG